MAVTVRLSHAWVRTAAPAAPPPAKTVKLSYAAVQAPTAPAKTVKLSYAALVASGQPRTVKLSYAAMFSSGSAGLTVVYRRVAGQWKPITLYVRRNGLWTKLA